MSAPTLTDPILMQLVGFLELAEEPGEREEFMGRIYAILPRYEAALALAEAIVSDRDAWAAVGEHRGRAGETKESIIARGRKAAGASRAYREAYAAYREARS